MGVPRRVWNPTLGGGDFVMGAPPRAGDARAGSGWVEEGAMVNFYKAITPPMPWARVGTCWADVSHPVVACEPWPL